MSQIKKIKMKKLMYLAVALFVISATLESCSKYEDGPKLSLRGKKGRLAGDWTLSQELYNGNSVSLSGTTSTMTIDKDGSLKGSYTTGSFSISYTGKWELVDKKDKLKVVIDGNGDSDGDTSIITMLKNKELRTKSLDGKTVSYYTAN